VFRGFAPSPDILRDPAMLYIAIGILGATVMPHNLYLHSSIVQTRKYEHSTEGKREAIRFATIDSTVALMSALFINAAILIVAAAAFHGRGEVVEEIDRAHELLSPLLGAALASTLFAAALLATVSANRYESMNEDELLVNLESTLSSALSSEARGDADAAVAKTAAIKNIQKALTARILKRLDDGQPLVEVARKMKAIEGMQPQINDMERRLGIMQSVEPVLENAIKTLQKVVDVRGMGKK